MSYSWYGRFSSPPTLAALDRAFRNCDARARSVVSQSHRGDCGGKPFVLREPEALDDLQAELTGSYLNVYVPGDSAAGIELSWDAEQGLRVRCLGLASAEDYDLALAMVAGAIKSQKVVFTDEEGEEVDPAALQKSYGASFRADQQEACCALVAKRVEELSAGRWVAVQTPVRPLFVDATVFERFNASAPSGFMKRTAKLVAHLKRLVWLGSGQGTSKVSCPQKLKVTANGKSHVAERFELGASTLICDPFDDQYTIVAHPEVVERLVVRWEDLVTVLKGRGEWLDGHQLLVPSLDDAACTEVFEAAADVAEVIYAPE
jgi:hypothetical protein